MGKDTRATDAGSRGEAGLRARSTSARRAAGDPGQTRAADGDRLGPFDFDEARLTAWGREIGRLVAVPAVFALRGDLGAGKSVLARAIARGAGVTGPMPSPTFNLLFQYQTDELVVNHLDLYRLNDPSEVWELGWRDLGEDDQIVLIEWPERAELLLPAPRWDVHFGSSASGAQFRSLMLVAVGDPPELPVPA